MSYYNVHKSNHHLYAKQPNLRNMAKDRKNQRSATKALLYLDDSDYYALEDDHYADDYYEESLYEEDDCEEYMSQRAPLTVNLLSVQTRCAQSKKTKTKNTARSSGPAKEAEKEVDPLAYLVNTKPRLVRSKSFTSEQPRASRRRPSFTGFEATTSSTGTALPAVYCIQSLIPAKSSVVGPTPRASLTVSSSKCHSAVLLTWSLHCPEPRVLPLIGWLNLQVAEKMQTELRRRLASDLEAAGWQTYWNMSTTLYERREEWVALLEDSVQDGPTQAHQRWKYLSQGCIKATMTLGECYSHYEMLQNLEQKVNAPSERVAPEKVDDNNPLCLVCSEEMEAGATCQLLACGHGTCMDCSKAYLKSAAASGQGSIKCSAYKCDVSVNIFDAAHILNEDDHETWERLVRFALERGDAPPGARFCPARNCGRLVKPTNSGSSQHPGFNMLMCDCGTSRCRDCKYEAHPGVTCSDYKMLRRTIDSGKLDAELANVKWVIKHSRPCPKCQYPIEKDGGCNHVRCQRCDNYFCFQCGGEGQLCMAYHCKNTNKYWHEDTPNYDEGQYGAMSNLVDKYRAYRSTRCKLSTLVNSLAASCDDQEYLDDDKAEVLLEIQCLQALLWVHVASISRMMSNGEHNLRQKKAALSLELVLHGLSLRALKQQTKIKPTQEALAAPILGLPPPKRLSHCKQLAKDRQQQPGGGGGESFQEIFVDQELQELFSADSTRFAKKARDAIQDGIQSLCPPLPKKSNRRRRRNKLVVEEGPLNEKMERPKDPWRNGYHNISAADEEKDWSDDGNRSTKRSDRRWKKNKARVRARRDASLGLNAL